MSPEASSKFSTSLACMFLLQREAALMTAFHTWISRTHYSVLLGAQTDLEQYTLLNVLYLIEVGNGDEMPLISIITVLVLYIPLLPGRRTKTTTVYF